MINDIACDVLVIGAGPAGSTAARVAAEKGARVVLLERRPQVGVPVQCAGYVSKAIRWHLRLADDCIVQAVDRLRVFLPDGTSQETEAPGYILRRSELDRSLAISAVKAGVRLLLRTAALGHGERGVLARQEGQQLTISARVIIGADGPRSLVARWMGMPLPRLAQALQYEVVLRERLTTAEVHFRPVFAGGYAWLFPAGETARVGAAFVGESPKGVAGLRDFLAEMEDDGRVVGSAFAFTGGFVPVGGVSRLWRENMLLVGDAAGQTHPITGAGILNAIVAGEMAGQAAAQAAVTGDLHHLEEYEEEWRQILGPSMERAVEKRTRLEEMWGSPPNELAHAIRQSWMTFGEYYDRG